MNPKVRPPRSGGSPAGSAAETLERGISWSDAQAAGLHTDECTGKNEPCPAARRQRGRYAREAARAAHFSEGAGRGSPPESQAGCWPHACHALLGGSTHISRTPSVCGTATFVAWYDSWRSVDVRLVRHRKDVCSSSICRWFAEPDETAEPSHAHHRRGRIASVLRSTIGRNGNRCV